MNKYCIYCKKDTKVIQLFNEDNTTGFICSICEREYKKQENKNILSDKLLQQDKKEEIPPPPKILEDNYKGVIKKIMEPEKIRPPIKNIDDINYIVSLIDYYPCKLVNCDCYDKLVKLDNYITKIKSEVQK